MEESELHTFRPTLEEWNDLPRYVEGLAAGGARSGIVKLKAPAGWEPDLQPKEDRYNPSQLDLTITRPLQQTIRPTSTAGAFQSTSKVTPPISVERFARLAVGERQVTPPHESYTQLEQIYWDYERLDRTDDAVYGADVPGSLIAADRKIWSRPEEPQLFTEMIEQLVGPEKAYLYFGMWRATFSWHIEDMDLYGVNYLHYGAPKTWYCVPPEDGHKLERAVAGLFPHWRSLCSNFLRHKICMVSPQLLRQQGVRVTKVVQEERDLIVVFPHAYHAGFNHGFNIAEASNYGTPSWVEHGKRHRACACSDRDSAFRVDMEPFIAAYQPGMVAAWRAGRDEAPHPNDSPALVRVWQFCTALVDGESVLPSELLARLELPAQPVQPAPAPALLAVAPPTPPRENSPPQQPAPTLKDKTEYLTTICKLQLRHLKQFREILQEFCQVELFLQERDGVNEDEFEYTGDLENSGESALPEDTAEEVEVVLTPGELRKTLKCAKIKLPRQRTVMKSHLENLPNIVEDQSLLKKRKHNSSSADIVQKTGFADISAAELDAKRSKFSCRYKHNMWPCKKCSGCVRPDCGTCVYCLDKPKFGGRNIQKQKCVLKKCSNPVVRYCDYCTWNI